MLAGSGRGSYYLSMRQAALNPYRWTSSPNRPWCVDIPEALSELNPPRRQRKFFETKKLADGECERLKALKDNQSEEHTSELQSPDHLVCRLLLEKKKRRDQPT